METRGHKQMPMYHIDVYTGTASPGVLAGNCANIHLTLYGTGASTDELVLDPKTSTTSRELVEGAARFSLGLGDLGDLKRLRVRYDDTGLGPAWFLDRITVLNEDSGEEWSFPCNRWLARHEDDGEIERTLDVA